MRNVHTCGFSFCSVGLMFETCKSFAHSSGIPCQKLKIYLSEEEPKICLIVQAP